MIRFRAQIRYGKVFDGNVTKLIDKYYSNHRRPSFCDDQVHATVKICLATFRSLIIGFQMSKEEENQAGLKVDGISWIN